MATPLLCPSRKIIKRSRQVLTDYLNGVLKSIWGMWIGSMACDRLVFGILTPPGRPWMEHTAKHTIQNLISSRLPWQQREENVGSFICLALIMKRQTGHVCGTTYILKIYARLICSPWKRLSTVTKRMHITWE